MEQESKIGNPKSESGLKIVEIFISKILRDRIGALKEDCAFDFNIIQDYSESEVERSVKLLSYGRSSTSLFFFASEEKKIAENFAYEVSKRSASSFGLHVIEGKKDQILNEILAAENTILNGEANRLSQRNVKLLREMAVLRASYEEDLEAFRRLEGYCFSSGKISQELAFAIEPKGEKIQLTANTSPVSQRLLCDSVGFSGFSIFVSDVQEDVGFLLVHLKTLEDESVVEKWIIPSDKLHEGWMDFSLSTCMSIDKRTLLLEVQWEGEGSAGLSLGLSHPDYRTCASQGEVRYSRTLAIRGWRGLPNTTPIHSGKFHYPGSFQQKKIVLGSARLAAVENLSGIDDFVKYIEPNSILVHPISQYPSLAKLSNVIPAGAISVSAKIGTHNSQATRVEYAVVISPHSSNENNISQNAVRSEWVGVDPLVDSQVHIFLNQPIEDSWDLYLATRIEEAKSNAFCWAYFKEITVEMV